MERQRLRLILACFTSSRRLGASSLTLLLIAFVCAACQWVGSSNSNTALTGEPLVTYEIRYRLPEAGEVFLVWGIDGWAVLAPAHRPPGTTIRDGLMYTSMDRVGDVFSVRLQVPADASTQYVFWVTRTASGVETDIWDLHDDSEREYHAIATVDGVTEVQARTSAQNEVAARALAAGLGERELSWTFIGLVLVAGGLTVRSLPRFGLKLKPSIRSANWRLGLILVGATLMRVNYITQPFVDAFSWRQVSVAMMAENFYRTDPNIFYPEVNWSGPGPNYQGREFQTVSYIAALLYPMTGQQDWVGRGIAIAFGVWGIFALYQLVRRVWSEDHAILAAAIMAVLPGSISIERSFLPDPAMVALVVTSFWLLVIYLQTERWRYLVWASLIAAWGFCTKIPGLILGLPMAYTAFAILGWRKALRPDKLIALVFFAVTTLVPVVVYYLWARHLALTYPPYHFAGDGNWLWQDGLQRWLEQIYFIPSLTNRFIDWLWSAPIMILVAVGLFIRPPAKADHSANVSDSNPTEEPVRAPWLFHSWLLAGVIYYLIGAQELVKNPWNFHILDPMAAALAAHALIFLGRLANRVTRRSVTGVVTIASLFVIGGVGYKGLDSLYYPYAEEAYHLGLALGDVSDPDDLVITVGKWFGDPVPIYYSGRRGWGFPPPSLDYDWTVFPEDDDVAIQLFEDLRTQGADWLGIVNQHYDEIWQEHPKFAAHIERTCEFTQTTPTGKIYRILTPEEVSKVSTP